MKKIFILRYFISYEANVEGNDSVWNTQASCAAMYEYYSEEKLNTNID